MRKLPIFLLSSCLMAVPAYGQVTKPVESVTILMPCSDEADGDYCSSVYATRDLPDDRITVLASGHWDRIDQSAQTISVLDADDLQQIQGPDFSRALTRLPGVSLTRNGGVGSFTGLSVRGAASERVLVLIDGARLNDTAGPAGGFDFGSVVSGSVGRVELLRGSNSLIWGSDALGGVIHLSSRQIEGVEGAAEYGGDEQFSGNLALGGSGDGVQGTITASYITREGFSSAGVGTEDDGFQQLALTARGNAEISDEITGFASARYASGEAEIDGFPAPNYTLDDTAERQDTRQISARGGLEYAWDGTLVTASFAHAKTQRDLVDEASGSAPYYSTTGRSNRAELRARQDLTDQIALEAGGDWEWTFFTDGASAASADIGSAHAMVSFGLGDNTEVSVGGRYDHHNQFGGEWSFAANAYVAVAQNLRLTTSFGEGFKAPSLFQLFSDFGNLALMPERSRSYDAGLHYGDGAISSSVIVFRRDSSNLIDYISCFGSTLAICSDRPNGTYDNIGRARSQGVEVEASAAITDALTARAAYAYIDSENRDSGLDLARRPQHAGTFSLDWLGLNEALSLGADLRVVSSSFDNASNSVRLDGYALLDLRISFAVDEHVTLFGRVENAWDEDYQTAAGYQTQGRAAFIGVRGRI